MAIGSILDGRYRIDGVLGTGGMGRVYRGEHTSLGRIVAIKVLHADLGRNKEASARFQREALASGRLDHPNIVGVSDFGVLGDGLLYLVMEALEGESVGERLEREKHIGWFESVQIIRGVLAGLRHAHDRGVVHRDIKPDNIFLARKDGDLIVKILDFGIAKLYAGDTADPASTRAGLTVGTPAYLSPEQAVGGAITPASDIYSTSVVLYEMLAGRAPYEDKDPLAMLTAHVSREPPFFRDVAPALELPQGLEQVIRRGLAKVAKERIGSATEYNQLLDEVMRHAGYDFAPTPRSSGQMIIPTPVPGSMKSPFATPMPFAHAATPAPDVNATSGSIDIHMTATALPVKPKMTLAEISEPIPRKWIIGAVVFVIVAIIGAFAVLANRSSSEGAGGSGATPVIVPLPTAVTVDRDTQYKALVHDLETGKTCADRKSVIPKLVELGDERAIADLKKARYRGRGGVLGIGESNTNSCLRGDAELAIKALGGSLK
ncbi:MAG: serine/threonine protein kinase with repeat [Myxococcales bacterium]|nr:serine/threonine protein kinase with repeat [Myxococcales bacterium]